MRVAVNCCCQTMVALGTLGGVLMVSNWPALSSSPAMWSLQHARAQTLSLPGPIHRRNSAALARLVFVVHPIFRVWRRDHEQVHNTTP